MGKLTLILGGARSGKSSLAESLAKKRGQNIAYIATAEAQDPEMERRIEKHQEARPVEWKTLEIPSNIAKHVGEKLVDYDLVILDCLTLLGNNLIMQYMGDIDHPNEELIIQKGLEEVESLLEFIEASDLNWIVVTNEVGLGLVPAYPIGRIYRDMMGMINKRFAEMADEVLLMFAGIPLKLDKIEIL